MILLRNLHWSFLPSSLVQPQPQGRRKLLICLSWIFHNVPQFGISLPYKRLTRTLNTFGFLSLTFAPVRTNAIISPLSLHARWSLKPWHQPIVPFPSVAIPLNTLLAYLLRLWHTGIIVESTNVMPIHLPKAPRLKTLIQTIQIPIIIL